MTTPAIETQQEAAQDTKAVAVAALTEVFRMSLRIGEYSERARGVLAVGLQEASHEITAIVDPLAKMLGVEVADVVSPWFPEET